MFLFVVAAVLQLQLVFKAAALEGELGELEVQGADGDLDLQGAVVELGEAFAEGLTGKQQVVGMVGAEHQAAVACCTGLDTSLSETAPLSSHPIVFRQIRCFS